MTAHLLAFVVAAGLLTMTPGLDTLLVLRAATRDGRGGGARAAAGVTLGVLIWGAAVAFGLAALLAASRPAFQALKVAGAIYLVWVGARLLIRPRAALGDEAPETAVRHDWFRRGLLGNLLNPKMGVFYVSFLPQFVPPGAPLGPFLFLLAAIHAGLGVLWCGTLVLAGDRLGAALREPKVARTADRVTGLAFLGFAAALALD